MNISCPVCQTMFRVDPAKVPAAGVKARCSACQAAFRLDRSGATALDAEPAAAAAVPATAAAPRPLPTALPARPAPAAAPAPAQPGQAPRRASFRNQDPEARAQRIARALVSDIVAYNKDRLNESRAAGSMRNDFREEIRKSWDEYVEQVGLELAKRTPYFRDALNDILAQGQKVF